MNQQELDEYFEKAKHLEELVVPKLYGMQNNGSGATIHKTNELIGQIKNTRVLAEMHPDTFHIVVYREYIRTAEIWMENFAKDISS